MPLLHAPQVKERLAGKMYSSPLQFRDDVRLIWSNCATYNPVGHPVRQSGDQLSDIFERAWAESSIEQMWAAISGEVGPTSGPRSALYCCLGLG